MIAPGSGTFADAFAQTCPKCAGAGIMPAHYLHTAGWMCAPAPTHQASAHRTEAFRSPHDGAALYARSPHENAAHTHTAHRLRARPHRMVHRGLWGEHARLLLGKEPEHAAALRGWVGSKEVAAIPDESHWGTLFTRLALPTWGHLLTYMLPGDDPKTGVRDPSHTGVLQTGVCGVRWIFDARPPV
jgi:hypothetical protein